jgi:hypothetical protein
MSKDMTGHLDKMLEQLVEAQSRTDRQLIENQKRTEEKIDKLVSEVHDVKVKFARFEGANFIGELEKLTGIIRSLEERLSNVETFQASKRVIFVILGLLGAGGLAFLWRILEYWVKMQ